VLRTLGVRPAVLAMMLDAVKGTVAVLVAQRLTNGVAAPVMAGLASMVGHVYPVWLRFRGGKGVATAAGAFAVLAPVAAAVAAAAFLLTVALTRFISVGSMVAALTLAGWAIGSDARRSSASEQRSAPRWSSSDIARTCETRRWY
jgi:glycerol-3-phosphate acyltransferase PlsY